MPPREDDDVAPRRPCASNARRLLIPGGFALAVLATLAVFLTDNEQYLRVAVVAVAWAFVLATFAAGRRDTDRVAAAAREAELRQAYELELDREVAARREYELELEHELRREAEQTMRYELDALRGDIASLSGLRDEVARVSELRGDLAALSGLRDDVARVAALRDDVAALMSLRQDLGQLAELRSEMGRLRVELTEQLSSEMLVERITMRTQASRLPAEPGRLDGPARALEGGWADDVPPRELTGGWPAVRLDEPRETQQFEEVRIQRSGLRPPVPAPPTAGGSRWETPPPSAGPRTRRCRPPGTRHEWPAAPATSAWPAPPVPAAGEPGYRHAVDEPVGPPPTTMSPIAPSSIARPPAPVPPPPVAAPPARTGPRCGRPRPRSSRTSGVPLERPPVPPPAAEPAPSPLDWLAARSLLDAPSRSAAPTTSRPRCRARPTTPWFRRSASTTGGLPRGGAGRAAGDRAGGGAGEAAGRHPGRERGQPVLRRTPPPPLPRRGRRRRRARPGPRPELSASARPRAGRRRGRGSAR